jgi:hypothetical protein
MIKEINYSKLSIACQQGNDVCFVEQHYFPKQKIIGFYAFLKKMDCGGPYCVAIFTIKPKKP